MKSKVTIILHCIILIFLAIETGYSQNPIIQTNYTADPAPLVYNDTIFLYTSHDEDDAIGFKMLNWMLYTSTDMVNWTDHGIIASLKDFKWVKTDNGAWAPQCIHRNGKFYLYCPIPGGVGIGVLVSDSPYGPFEDPLGKPLIQNSVDDIDPTVFIDDDGQAYLYWGNPKVYFVKLNEDMISYSGEIIQEPTTPEDYQEGPWIWKRNGHYYMAYASTCCPEGIGYAMSDSPKGPWEHKGKIMDPDGRSSGNHPGIIEYKGNSYVFGFNYAINFSITDIHRERRSICLEKMTYNPDGTISKLPWWSETGVEQMGTLNPYVRTEAECIAWASGIKTAKNEQDGMFVTEISNGDYIKVRSIDFGTMGAGVFHACLASSSDGGILELQLDSLKGIKIGSLPVSNTGGWNNWNLESAAIDNTSGIHDVYLVFKGKSEQLFNFDSWKFDKKKKQKELVAINASVPGFKIDTINDRNTIPLRVVAVYADGTQEDISKSAHVSLSRKGIVKVNGSTIEGIGYGLADARVSYKGKSDSIHVLVKNYKNEHTVKRIFADTSNLLIFRESKYEILMTAEFLDGHTQNITNAATFDTSDPRVTEVKNGTITAIANGDALINVSHTDELGNVNILPIRVKVTNRDPYVRNKAADYNGQSGIQAEACSDTDGGKDIGYIQQGDWISFNYVDFSMGASSFKARVSSATQGGYIEIYLDSIDGEPIGSLAVSNTGGWQSWVTRSCKVKDISGVHTLYFKFTGNEGFLLNLNWWRFNGK